MARYKKSVLERALKNTASHSLKVNHVAKRLLFRRGRWFFVTSTPKSASTFLARVLSIATGFGEYKLTDDLHKENDLYLPKLVDAYNMNLVCRQHTKASPANLKLIAQFGMRPIVVTRNFADTVVSVRDQVLKVGGVAWFWPPATFHALDETSQYDYIIDIFIPWCVDFIAGWSDAEKKAGVPVLWLGYDEIVADKVLSAQRALQHVGIDVAVSKIEQGVNQSDGWADSNFNVGVGGRGASRLTAEQLGRLARMEQWIHRLEA